jgi:phosphatidylserine/phosphatidylglycerophosphate/cardiolipin synthase-like enzyme
MAKFLNTRLLSNWIERLIDETEKELIILVPYINISDKIYKKLEAANARGVETVLIYREDKLTEKEKAKLFSLDNLNLLHHPNLHAKCYYNEKYLIIGSMNLYEYSEKNNREMGVLLHKEELTENGKYINYDTDKDDVFKDAVNEIREVIKSSELERQSRDTIENGFELEIIKTDVEKKLEYCKLLNKHFNNKIFEPHKIGDEYYAYCKNYFDNIDVSIDYRVTIYMNFEDYHLKSIFSEFSKIYDEFMCDGFKIYWNSHKSYVYLYSDSRNKSWKNAKTPKEQFDLYKSAISLFINYVKPHTIVK